MLFYFDLLVIVVVLFFLLKTKSVDHIKMASVSEYITPFNVCCCWFCGVILTLLQFLIYHYCGLLGLNGLSCCWKAREKKKMQRG